MSKRNRYEVVIIGGGIIGMSIAYHLSEAGHNDVVVIEKDLVGSGTTAKSLGGFRHQYSTKLNISFSIESIKFLENFEEALGIGISIRKDGYLFMATSDEQMQTLEKQTRMQRDIGLEIEILNPNAIRTLCPYLNLDGIVGASYGPMDGHAETSAVLQGFTSESRRNGVSIEEGVEVTGFDYDKSSKKVHSIKTSRGEIQADSVILCAGPYTGVLSKLLGLNVPNLSILKNYSPYRQVCGNAFVNAPDIRPRINPRTW